MKILLLQDDFAPESKGGSAVVVEGVAKALVAAGHQVLVVCTTQRKESAGEGVWQGVAVHRIYSDYHERWRAWVSLYNPTCVRALHSILVHWKPDVVHAHNIHTHLSYASLKEAKKTGARVFLTAHDVMLVQYGKYDPNERWWKTVLRLRLRYNPLRNVCIRYYIRFVDQVFSVSAAVERVLREYAVPSAVLHNGIAVEAWKQSTDIKQQFITEHGLMGKPILLFGGRISPAKGGSVIVEVLNCVRESVPETTLLLLGKETAYTQALQKKAEALGMPNALVCTGWLAGEKLQAAYWSANVVLVPSLYLDPLPTVVLEAMACSKPVVGTPLGGLPEMVVNGTTGYVVDPHNVERFAGAITSLLQDSALATKMGRAGYERVVTEFTLERHVQKLHTLYEKDTA